MARRSETAGAPAHRQRSAAKRPERSGGPGRRENLERSVREEARLRAGEILSPDRLERGDAGSSALRDMQGRSANLGMQRSEEHTSELQSLMRISYAVSFLKKNNKLRIYILTEK